MRSKKIGIIILKGLGYLISFLGFPFIGIIIAGKSKSYSSRKKRIIIFLFSLELLIILGLALLGAIIDGTTTKGIYGKKY